MAQRWPARQHDERRDDREGEGDLHAERGALPELGAELDRAADLLDVHVVGVGVGLELDEIRIEAVESVIGLDQELVQDLVHVRLPDVGTPGPPFEVGVGRPKPTEERPGRVGASRVTAR